MVRGACCRGLLAALALATASAHAAPTADRIVLDTSWSEDSDGQRQHSGHLGLVQSLPSLGISASLGVRGGYWRLVDSGGHVEFASARLDHQQDIGPVALGLRAQQLVSEDWSPALGGLSATWHAAPRWDVAASAEADIVDTVAAARHETRFETYSLSSDYRLLESLTLVGGLQQQRFSDGNERQGRLLRLVFSPRSVEGLNLQLRLRRADSDFRGVGYFSPGRFEEGLLLVQYSRALMGERFVLSLQAGTGEQQVDAIDTSTVYLAEARLRGWFTDRFGLEGKSGCSNAGSLGGRAAAGGYRYCHASFSLLGTW